MSKKNSSDNYNYNHFKASDYNFKVFGGPKPGEKFIDFTAVTTEGKRVSLSDYLDKPIVLDTGSITCPMYANSKSPMNELMDAFPNYHFLLLYVREAHPGKRTDGIKTSKEKCTNAIATRKLYNERRELLIDDLNGKGHLLYGGMPNMVYLIDTDGTVRFRANWTNPKALEKALKDPKLIVKKDFYEVNKPSPFTAIRTLMIGGFRALYEFLVNLPKLIKQHKEVGTM